MLGDPCTVQRICKCNCFHSQSMLTNKLVAPHTVHSVTRESRYTPVLSGDPWEDRETLFRPVGKSFRLSLVSIGRVRPAGGLGLLERDTLWTRNVPHLVFGTAAHLETTCNLEFKSLRMSAIFERGNGPVLRKTLHNAPEVYNRQEDKVYYHSQTVPTTRKCRKSDKRTGATRPSLASKARHLDHCV